MIKEILMWIEKDCISCNEEERQSDQFSCFIASTYSKLWPSYNVETNEYGLTKKYLHLRERTLSIGGEGGGGGGFYKFFKKNFVAHETIDPNISWPSNFFRKCFMAPPINFSFLSKAYLQQCFRVVLSNIQITHHQRSWHSQ